MLRSFSGSQIQPRGITEVSVEGPQGQELRLPLVVVEGNQPNLLGRDWLESLQLDWKEVKQISHCSQLDALLAKHADLFSSDLGAMKGVKAKIHIDQAAVPQFYRVRPVPFALRAGVEKELDKLVERGSLFDTRSGLLPLFLLSNRINQ